MKKISRNGKVSTGQHYDFRKMLDICGLSQADLADRIDVRQATVSNWATAKRRPPGAVTAYLNLLAAVRGLGG